MANCHTKLFCLIFSFSFCEMLFQRIAKSSQVTIQRGMLRPQINIPYRGIYRRDGDNVRKNDVLVVQKHVNYHPGLNVSCILI